MKRANSKNEQIHVTQERRNRKLIETRERKQMIQKGEHNCCVKKWRDRMYEDLYMYCTCNVVISKSNREARKDIEKWMCGTSNIST